MGFKGFCILKGHETNDQYPICENCEELNKMRKEGYNGKCYHLITNQNE